MRAVYVQKSLYTLFRLTQAMTMPREDIIRVCKKLAMCIESILTKDVNDIRRNYVKPCFVISLSLASLSPNMVLLKNKIIYLRIAFNCWLDYGIHNFKNTRKQKQNNNKSFLYEINNFFNADQHCHLSVNCVICNLHACF